jgi:hypothetical protein
MKKQLFISAVASVILLSLVSVAKCEVKTFDVPEQQVYVIFFVFVAFSLVVLAVILWLIWRRRQKILKLNQQGIIVRPDQFPM